MSEPYVNAQITDAVTQTNVKVIGESPAMGMSALYQATVHAMSTVLMNAAYAQQQTYVTAQASTTLAVNMLYSLDNTTAAASTTHAVEANTLEAHVLQSSAALKNIAEPASSALQPQIEAAVKLANDSGLENAGRFAYALRATTDAAAAGLSEIAQVHLQQCLGIVQNAATAMCLQAMLRHPEKAEDYERVMRTIRELA